MKIMKRLFFITFSCFALLLSSCGYFKYDKQGVTGVSKVMCDASFENIIDQEVEVFEYQYPNANIIPYYIDEHSAIDSLLNLKTQVIITTHKLTKNQIDYLESKDRKVWQQQIAVDAIALIVNKANTIDELSVSDVADIMSGRDVIWHDIEPSKLGKIQIVFDYPGSSTVRYMQDSILKGKPFTKEVFAQKSSKGVFDAVKNNKNAIGVIGVNWITDDMKCMSAPVGERYNQLQKNDTAVIDFKNDIKVLKIRADNQLESFKPYQAYIYDARYPLFRSVYVISTAPAGTPGHSFLAFITGFIGQKIIQNTGILPAVIQPRLVSIE
jgi:phosphate transport system substrate-binding protein